MPEKRATTGSNLLKDYVKLLGLSTSILMFFTVVEGGVASFLYGRNANSIEAISHRGLAQGWTIAVLWVPLTLQLLILISLSVRVRKHKSDEVIRHYFKFYFLRTFISSWSYITLWLSYTIAIKTGADKDLVFILRGFALAFIALLIYFVVQAAYLITRSVLRTDKRTFTESEVEDKYDHICTTLEAASLAARLASASAATIAEAKQESGTGTETIPVVAPSPNVSLIFKWLLKDRDPKIYRVVYGGTISDLDVPHLLEALNRVVSSRRFYAAARSLTEGRKIPHDEIEEVSRRQIESENREYVEQHLLTTSQDAGAQDAGAVVDEFVRRLKRWVTSRFGGEKRRDRQMGQQDGIAMFPFYTMVFFFSVFLCIAHLFGFAFAFEDKHVQLSDPRKQVALFMTDDLFEDSERNGGSSLFHMGDFRDAAGLAGKLRYDSGTSGPISDYLRKQFAVSTQVLLDEYDGSRPLSYVLHNALIEDLNRLLKGKPLLDEHLRSLITLREETKKMAHDPSGDGVIRYNRSLLEDVYPNEIGTGRFTLTKLWRMFYFNPAESGFHVSMDRAAEKDKRIAQINMRSFAYLVRQVKETLDSGKIVRIGLVGWADDGGVSKGTPSLRAKDTYASNYDLAAARIKTVRYDIQRQLIFENVLPSQLAALEWIELPLSNDASLSPKFEKGDNEGNKTEKRKDDLVRTNGSAAANPLAKTVSGQLMQGLKNKIYDEVFTEDVRKWWKRLYVLAQKGELKENDYEAAIEDIGKLNKLKSGNSDENDETAHNQTKANYAKRAEAQAAESELTERIEEELYGLEEPSGSKRSVGVFFYEAVPLDQKSSPRFKRMALMDYLYFAMCTLTTTGFGDVRPTTPYAKFLCTLANMTEFFFIVVFFNTLLSFMRTKGERL